MNKYRVILAAYRKVDKNIMEKIEKYSIRTIKNNDDLSTIKNSYSGKGFSMNDRVSIYVDWINDEIKNKINEGYTIVILELPIVKKDGELVKNLKSLDIEFGEEVLILKQVDV